ncbi:MAG: DNA translocase FtsK [Candidatus Cloacimonadaceae bacterium]|nr:DNA translocase FtsK [Candidatus Cloacimonadaceae bacterium]
MAKTSKKKIPASTRVRIKAWHKRLISGALTVLSILIILSLAFGFESIKTDVGKLSANGGLLSWFSQSETPTSNPVGVFGIMVGYLFVFLFGYWMSLAGFAIVGLVSLQYFLEPEAPRSRQKGYLLLIVLFLLQVLLAGGMKSYDHSIIPLFLWKILFAVFRGTGTNIILISSMLLALVLIFEYRRIKSWVLLLWEDLARRAEMRENEEKSPLPTINKDEIKGIPIDPVINPQPPAPIVQRHDEYGREPMEELLPKKDKGETKKPKPAPIDEEDDDREYVVPSISDFLESPVKLSDRDRKEIENQILSTSDVLKNKLAEFGIEAEVRNVNIGPIITQYELEPAKGIKVSKFSSLADDLALAIKAKSIRVQAPIPGRGLIGIEIPNLTRDMIYLRDLLLSEEMRNSKAKLMFGLGKDISGKPVVTDLAKMPHLLIAGATGSGKSVCINAIIMSLIMRVKPDDLRLILIDPKRVELAGYNDLPHLIGSVVTEPDTALETMYWAVKEMERRYELLQEARVRDITGFNERAAESDEFEKLPYIVIIVDEFADLIMTSGKDIELPITRLAQMARAVGIHLILATQRPSIKVITGIIKANFPARIAFQVSSRVDSRVILDMIGAERLLGNGDMLFLPPGKAVSERIHGAFVSDHEIARTCDFLGMQPKPKQDFSLPVKEEGEFGEFDYDDELFPEAARLIVSANTASVSMLQRHFKIGYARAGRLIDLLERARVIGPHLGSKSRDVLANREDLIHMGIIRGDR